MTLKQYIKQTYKEGQIFSFKDLPDAFRKPSSVVQLSRFVKSQEIGKLMKGVYYVPRKSELFGKMPPYSYSIIEYVCKKTGGYVSGDSVYNEMGLTEQVPTIKEIFCKKQLLPMKILGTKIKFRKVQHRITRKAIYEMRILDALTDSKRIAGTTEQAVVEKIGELIRGLDEGHRQKVFEISKYYPSETREKIRIFLS